MGTRRWFAAGLVTVGTVLAVWSSMHAPRVKATGRGAGVASRRATAAPPAAPRPPEPPARAPSPPPTGDVIVRAEWGSEVGALGRKAPSEGAPEAPMGFAVDERGRVHVLDQINSRIQVFEPGREPRVVPLPSDTFQDVDVDARGRTVAVDRLAAETVAFFDESGRIDHTVPLTGPGVPEGGAVTGIFAREDGTWVEVEHKELVRIADASGEPDPDRPSVEGRFSADGASLLVAAIQATTVVAVTSEPVADRGVRFAASVEFPLPVLALHALESDAEGSIYLAANTIRESAEPPFDVTEEHETIVVLSRDGRELGRVEVAPPQGPEEQFRPIRVGKDGQIYQLVASASGATLSRFSL